MSSLSTRGLLAFSSAFAVRREAAAVNASWASYGRGVRITAFSQALPAAIVTLRPGRVDVLPEPSTRSMSM